MGHVVYYFTVVDVFLEAIQSSKIFCYKSQQEMVLTACLAIFLDNMSMIFPVYVVKPCLKSIDPDISMNCHSPGDFCHYYCTLHCNDSFCFVSEQQNCFCSSNKNFARKKEIFILSTHKIFSQINNLMGPLQSNESIKVEFAHCDCTIT